MTDHGFPPAPHSSLEDISQEEENEIEDVNDDGSPTSNQDHNPPLSHSLTESDSRQEENEENDDGTQIANQPSYLARFSTWLEKPRRVLIAFFHLIPFQRDVMLFIKEGSAWGWIDQLDPLEKHPINWELPRIPYPKTVIFYETKKIKLSPEPPTVDNTKELVPIAPKSSIHDVLAFLARVDGMMGVFAMPMPLEESEFREGVLRGCKSRWQSALAATIVKEAVVAAAAALESVAATLVAEDETEAAAAAVVESVVSAVVDQEPMVVDDTTTAGDATELLSTALTGTIEETAIAAALEPVLTTVSAQDTMVVEETTAEPIDEQSMDESLEETIDETAAGAAPESLTAAAVADQDATAIGETSNLTELTSLIDALAVGDERRTAEDAAEVVSTAVEGPIEETAMETLAAPKEEDVIEIAPDEEIAPVELVAAPPQMNYRRALSIVCHQYADRIYATAEGVAETELQYLKLDNCNGKHCEQRVHAVTCNGQCRTRTCNGQCMTRGNTGNGEN